MSHDYFRKEALAAQQTRFAGSIVLRRPVQMRTAAFVSVAIGALFALYVGTCQYTRKVHVAGRLAPSAGAIQAVALQGGRIVRVLAHGGDRVTQGQPLFDLSAERADAAGGADRRIDASLSERRRTLEQELSLQLVQIRQRTANLEARARLGRDDVARLGDEIALQRDRWRRAQTMLARYRTLRQKGFVAEPQVATVENDVSDQLARLRALERTQRSAQAELLRTDDELAQLRTQAELYTTQAQRNVAALEQERAEQQGRTRYQIPAPATGVLTAMAAEAGETVQPGTPVATVLPAGSRLEARLVVPSSAIGFIQPGQRVLLRIAVFPYQKFGFVEGAVDRVDRAPQPLPAQANTEPGYMVVVGMRQQSLRAYGAERPFQAGMDLEADIQLDRRSLFEWILDPLLSVAGRRAATM